MSDQDPIPEVNEAVADLPFKYYIFDWDNNILHMPTRIHLEKKNSDGSWQDIAVSTSFYSVVRSDTENYRPPGEDWEHAFREFRDFEGEEESLFLHHTREALRPVIEGEKKPGPSFHQFRTALTEGRLFAIVTARGHREDTIRAGVEYFIDHVLTDRERQIMISNLRGYRSAYENDEGYYTDEEVLSAYLDLNRYHAITSPDFRARMGREEPGVEMQEEAKQFAVLDFMRHVFRIVHHSGVDKPISVGFSDDDPRNVRAVMDYIEQELHREFPQVKFVVYDTSEPDVPDGRKIVVAGQMEFDFG